MDKLVKYKNLNYDTKKYEDQFRELISLYDVDLINDELFNKDYSFFFKYYNLIENILFDSIKLLKLKKLNDHEIHFIRFILEIHNIYNDNERLYNEINNSMLKFKELLDLKLINKNQTGGKDIYYYKYLKYKNKYNNL